MSAHAQSDLLAPEPTWSTSTSAVTFALAIGDVDGDGRLDLVQGNYGVPSKLFLNFKGLETTPTWTSARADSVTCAALGDVNGDRLPDLILATGRGDAALYINGGRGPTYFSSAPDRLLRLGGATDITLADVDQDGDVDLIATRVDGLTSLYLNDAGAITDPAWSAAEGADRFALGDVDRDGALDLVTVRGERVSVHRGTRPFFEDSPSWSAPDSGLTSLALGDLDGDGDYDLVTGGMAPGATRIYENLGTGFDAVAAWTLVGEDSTSFVALGDADADGDLDLACGNHDRSRVYRNQGGLAAWAPAWQAPGIETAVVAWADLDGDGQLDLVRARLRTEVFDNLTGFFADVPQPMGILGLPIALGDVDGDGWPDLISVTVEGGTAELHRGNGSGFDSLASWSSPSAGVRAAALGDVDGDGDPDLVTVGDGAALYAWDGAGFGTAPLWTAPIGSTAAIALGDVDDDGDIDLVTGSPTTLPPLRLFLNRGQGYAAVEDWSDSQAVAEFLALGDVDGDRDLDLAVSSPEPGAGVRFFEYAGLNFKSHWVSNSNNRPHGVALEDINGDNRRDLVIAYDGSSAYYANSGELEVFPATATWNVLTPSFATDVAIGDPDADGDLDVIFTGVSGDPMIVIRNADGSFDSDPQTLPSGSRRIFLKDLDADGDLDLIADQPGGIVVYRGLREPAFRGTPPNPAHRLPNNPAVLRDARVTPAGDNARSIDFVVQDVESDSVWIRAEFAFRGSRLWSTVDSPQGRGLIGPLEATPGGSTHHLDWNLGGFPADRRPVVLRLRAIAYHQRLGPVQRSASYVVELEPIAVQRPVIDASPRAIEFPAITVGDTTSTILYVQNIGNRPLHITDFELLNIDEVRLNPLAPLELLPGERAQILMYYEPTVPVASGPGPGVARYLVIRSDDPTNPRDQVELIPNTRALTGRAQALLPTLPAPLGEPVVVQLLPDPFVHVESATLFYAPVGLESFTPVGMDTLGPIFFASIPASDVTEVGLRFYVQLENSQVRTTDPPRAPAAVYEIPVAVPRDVQVIPQPTSRGDFLIGRDINVQVGVPQGAQFVDGTLHYRAGGALKFEQEPILINFLLGVIRGTIPGAAVGPRGIEYWVEVSTMTQTIRHPASGPRAPDSIRTLVPSLAEPTVQPGMRYRMLSVPLDFGSGASRPLDALLSDQPEFGPYDPVRWRAFRFLGAAGTVERAADDPNFTLQLGRAFWIVSRVDHRVDTAPLEGLSVSTAGAFSIVLESGWNQIGHPFAFPVAWAATRPPNGIEPPVAFDPRQGTAGGYSEDPVAVLEPFQGYFVWNGNAVAETLFVPPFAAPVDSMAVASRPVTATGARPAVGRRVNRAGDAWTVVVVPRTSRAVGNGARGVVHPEARAGVDAFDAHDPPPPPGDWVGAGFVPPEAMGGPARAVVDRLHGLLRRDARPADPQGHRWEIELRSSRAREEIAVDLQLEGELPPDFELLVVDPQSRARMPLDRNEAPQWTDAMHIVSPGPAKSYPLVLLVGTSAFLSQESDAIATIPPRIVLEQNEPNPFNGTTRLRFGLNVPGRARLELFDVRGRRVAVLFDDDVPAGWQNVLWNGHDDAGREVASGVYVARLVSPGATRTCRVAYLK